MMQPIVSSLVVLLTLLLFEGQVHSLAPVNGGQSHFFDPIDAYDDLDAHTVTAGNQLDNYYAKRNQFKLQAGPISSTNNDSRPSLFEPIDGDLQQLLLAGKIASSSAPSSTGSATSAATTSPEKATSQAPTGYQRPSDSSSSKAPNQHQKRTLVSSNVAVTLSPGEQRKQHHWSALEDFYEKLRRQAVAPSNSNAGPSYSGSFEDRSRLDQQVLAYLNEQQRPIVPPIYSGSADIKRPSPLNPAKVNPFEFPIENINLNPGFAPALGDSIASRPPYSANIGSDSYLIKLLQDVARQRQNQSIEQQQQQQQQQQQISLAPEWPVYPQAQINLTNTSNDFASQPFNPWLAIQLVGGKNSTSSWSPTTPDSNVAQVRPTSFSDPLLISLLQPTQREAAVDLRRLDDVLLIEQQQKRAKHQQDTFGSWYDEQRERELLQEDLHCGIRNQYPMQLAAAKYSNLVSKLGSQAAANKVRITPGEYPSHVGIYNGIPPLQEDKYLCAGVWVHSRFVLTVASCLHNLTSAKLFARTNEWNSLTGLQANDSSQTQQQQQRYATLLAESQVIRQVAKVHVFPKYLNGSREHNLALLELIEPIDFQRIPFVVPACQAHSRLLIRAKSCWAPVRNVTMQEYFDAEGEGETKLRRQIQMAEIPIKLFANEELQCREQIGREFFNFNHPNYLCSADYRSKVGQWRNQLNSTDQIGSGIYCDEAGTLSLVSIVHPIAANNPSAQGYLDLSYYRPWMKNVIWGSQWHS